MEIISTIAHLGWELLKVLLISLGVLVTMFLIVIFIKSLIMTFQKKKEEEKRKVTPFDISKRRDN